MATTLLLRTLAREFFSIADVHSPTDFDPHDFYDAILRPREQTGMMAAPFLAFALSIGCALRQHQRAALVLLALALALTLAMFVSHASDTLPISL